MWGGRPGQVSVTALRMVQPQQVYNVGAMFHKSERTRRIECHSKGGLDRDITASYTDTRHPYKHFNTNRKTLHIKQKEVCRMLQLRARREDHDRPLHTIVSYTDTISPRLPT